MLFGKNLFKPQTIKKVAIEATFLYRETAILYIEIKQEGLNMFGAILGDMRQRAWSPWACVRNTWLMGVALSGHSPMSMAKSSSCICRYVASPDMEKPETLAHGVSTLTCLRALCICLFSDVTLLPAPKIEKKEGPLQEWPVLQVFLTPTDYFLFVAWFCSSIS